MPNPMLQAAETFLVYLTKLQQDSEIEIPPKAALAIGFFLSRLPHALFEAEAVPELLKRNRQLQREIERLRGALWLVKMSQIGLLADTPSEIAEDALRGTPRDMRPAH